MSTSLRLVTSTTALALGTALVVVPSAGATETTVKLPMACSAKLDTWRLEPRAGFAKGAERVYNSADDNYQQFRFSLPVSTPKDTVEVGESFDYQILSTTFAFPESLSVVNVAGASQLNLWLDLPDKAVATVDEIELGGDNADKFEVSVTEDNRLHIRGNSESNPADITSWGTDDPFEWMPGGAEITNLEVTIPAITLHMSATGTAGDVIQLTVQKTDPEEFSPNAFVQAYALGRLLQTDVPAFIRCGLSADDTGATKTLPADPFPAVTIAAAQKYATTAVIQLQDAEGTNLSEGTELLVTDSNGTTTHTAEQGGIVRLSYPLKAGETTTIQAAFTGENETPQEITLTGLNHDSTNNITLKQQTPVERYATTAIIQLQDAEGTNLSEGTELLVTDSNGTTTHTAEQGGIVRLSYPLKAGETTTIQAAFTGKNETPQEITLTGLNHDSTNNITLKQQTPVKRYATTVTVTLVDSEGKAMPEGTTVRVNDSSVETEYAAAADGVVSFTVSVKNNEKRAIRVAFADDAATSLTINVVGGENKDPVKATLKHKPVEKPQPQPRPQPQPSENKPNDDKGGAADSSSDPVDVGQTLGIVFGVLLGVPALLFMLRALLDYAKGLRLF